MAAVHSHATYVPARRGHWSRAENHVAEAADAAERSRDAMSISYAATAAAVLRHSRGDFQGVLSALEPVLNLESRVGAFMPGALEWPNLFGEALVRTGRLRQAEEFILDFLGAAERHDSPWAGVAARRALGLVRAAYAAWPLAISLLDEASAIALRAGMPFEAAQTVLERGVARAHAGGPQSGIDDVRSALSTFSELGARPFTDRASTILAALGGRPGARPSVPANALTPQELAVSRLVREGMSNRQIAGELFLSTKTVEFHLRHVYMKLGIHSRTQLVARSAELLDLGGVEDGADRSL
jgi:DNA-binding CsgD family transcriptional regulator